MYSVKLQHTKLILRNLEFLCTNNKLSEREMKRTILFTISTKRIKYLRISLIKKVKDLFSENYKTLTKKLKKTERNGKIYHAHELEVSILLKCPYHPKQSTDSMQSLSKYQWHFSQN